MAGYSRKRSADEMSISDLQVSPSTTVHGVVVGNVSPLKSSRKDSSRKWFDGQFTDGAKVVRMISFNPKLRSELESAKESGTGVALENCQVKTAQNSTDMEILLNNWSKVVKSPKKFEIDPQVTAGMSSYKDVNIGSIEDLAVNEHVGVIGKVVLVEPPTKVNGREGGTLTKQDFYLADSSGKCKCVAWENQVGVVEVGKSYRLKNVTVREFDGVRYFSLSVNSEVEQVADVKNVSEEVVGGESGGMMMVKAEVVLVNR